MLLELAEAAAERDVLLRSERLIAEEDDFVLVERIDNFLESLIIDVPRKVYT
jgi:hypothetical protein